MPELDLERLRRYTSSVRWQYAKTMPWCPHFYTLERWTPDLQGEFRFLLSQIIEHGYNRLFRGRTYRSLDLDDWYYWTMSPEAPETVILINRARRTADAEEYVPE